MNVWISKLSLASAILAALGACAAEDGPALSISGDAGISDVSAAATSASASTLGGDLATQDAASVPASSNNANCQITPRRGEGPVYLGPCVFFKEADSGSFSVWLDDGTAILPNIQSVSVTLTDDQSNADVTGMTSEGFNSRWGAASRSATDQACWETEEQTICVYAR